LEVEELIDDILRASDFNIALNLQVYINNKLAIQKSLGDTTQRYLDLADIEDALYQNLHPHVRDESYDIISYTIVIKTTSGHGKA
jgi:hypothetical protein